MANVTQFNVKTAANLRSQAPNSIQTLYSELLKRGSGNTSDVFRHFEGPDGALGYPVCRFTDFSKTAGQLIYFTKHGGLKAKPVLGDNVLRGSEEKLRYGTHSCYIDFVRNGTAWTRKQLRLMAAGRTVTEAMADELDLWLGGTRQDFILQRLRQRAVAGWNIFLPNNRGTIDLLTSTDLMTTTVVERVAGRAASLGAKAISNRLMDKGIEIPQYLFFGPNDVLMGLYSDSAYINKSLYSEERGKNNTITEGGFQDWRNQKIFHWNVVDDDVDGPIGSMFNPKAKLGTAITAGTGVVTVDGGGSGKTVGPDYFRYFPGNNTFTQYQEETLGADTNVYYLKIFNVTGADAGKWGFYSYTGSSDNIGTAITTTQRLGSAASGTRVTTLGTVVWSGTVNTDAHPIGSPIYLANAKGNVIGYVAALGSEAVLIGYGGGAQGDPKAAINGSTSYKGRSGSLQGSQQFGQDDDYGMQCAADIEAVMGVDVPLDTLGNPRNYILIPVVYVPPEVTA